MPAGNLFGDLSQVWLFSPLAMRPDHAGRRALRVVKQQPGERIAEAAPAAFYGDAAWTWFKEVSHLPLLDEWRIPIIEIAVSYRWLRFHPGCGVNALTIDLGTDDRYETAVGELIRIGQLKLPGSVGECPPAVGGDGEGMPPNNDDSSGKAPDDGEPEVGRRLTSEELADALAGFTGTESWFRHWLAKEMLYTDGVEFFAEQGGSAGAYWFLDIVATEYFPMLREEGSLLIRLMVDRLKGRIVVEDGNGRVLKEKKIKYTDMQPGEWRFYLTDNVLLLPSEY
jgi:hypothetical protein